MNDLVQLAREDYIKIGRVLWPAWSAADRDGPVRTIRRVLNGEACGNVVSFAEAEKIRSLARALRAKAPPARRVVAVSVNGGNAP